MKAKEVQPRIFKLFQVASLILFFGLEVGCDSEPPLQPGTTTSEEENKKEITKTNLPPTSEPASAGTTTNQNGITKETTKPVIPPKASLYYFGPPPKKSHVEGEFVVSVHHDIMEKVAEASIISKEDAIKRWRQTWQEIKKIKGQRSVIPIPEKYQNELKTRDKALNKVGEIIKKYLERKFQKSETEILAELSLLGMLVLKTDRDLKPERLKDAIVAAIKEVKPGIIDDKIEKFKVEKSFRLRLHAGSKNPPNDLYWLKPRDFQPEEGNTLSELWGLDKISMQDAWKKAEELVGTSAEIREAVVAILDTGVDLTQPDLVENLWENPFEKEHGMDEVDNEDINDYIDDIHGVNIRARVGSQYCANNQKEGDPSSEPGNDHGTGPALVIGAVGNNDDNHDDPMTAQPTERSMLGMGGGKNYVKIMPIKILCLSKLTGEKISYDGSSAAAIAGIEYAIKMGAHVINASWTVERPDEDEKLTNFRQAIEDALRAGITVVASAGNSGSTTEGNNDEEENQTPPQMFYKMDNVLVVGGVRTDDIKVSDSNFGLNAVNLVAPGDAIKVSVLSDIDGERHIVTVGGTSLAAPFVAGCAALIQAIKQTITNSENEGSLFPPKALKDFLNENVDPIPQLKSLVASGGRLNCHRALVKAFPQ